MRGRRIEEIEGSSIVMYICNTAYITPKWKDIRNADIMLNWNNMCSIEDIPKLGVIGDDGLNEVKKICWKEN